MSLLHTTHYQELTRNSRSTKTNSYIAQLRAVSSGRSGSGGVDIYMDIEALSEDQDRARETATPPPRGLGGSVRSRGPAVPIRLLSAEIPITYPSRWRPFWSSVVPWFQLDC